MDNEPLPFSQRLLHLLRLPALQKMFRFITSGVIAAGVNLLVLFLLVQEVGLYYLAASVVSFAVSMLVSFTLQKFWTFRNTALNRAHTQFALYALITGTNLGINVVVMYVLVSVCGVWYILAQIIAGLVIAVTGYLGYHYLVFKSASAQ